jgi:hypothetical protein
MFELILASMGIATFCGLLWIFSDARSRLNLGQAVTWSALYLVGIAFVGVGHLVILLLWCGTRPAKPTDLLKVLTALAPNAPPNLRHCLADTGIAIDPTEKKIALIRPGHRKVYDFADVRDYRWSIQQGGGNSGGPLDFAALAESRRVSRSNRANTGLFIRVRDIEIPEWQILFQRRSELQRWHEILQQAFEGSLAASM